MSIRPGFGMGFLDWMERRICRTFGNENGCKPSFPITHDSFSGKKNYLLPYCGSKPHATGVIADLPNLTPNPNSVAGSVVVIVMVAFASWKGFEK